MRKPALLAIVAAVVVASAMLAAWQLDTGAAAGPPRMSLTVTGAGTVCDSTTTPTSCSAPLGATFTLNVRVLTPPSDGYVAFQSFVDYGPNLTYTKGVSADADIIWPNAGGFQLRGQTGPHLFNHGASTAQSPPFPVSTFVGVVVAVSMTCTPTDTASKIKLLPLNDPVAGGDGALFVRPNQANLVPKAYTLGLYCTNGPTPTPTLAGPATSTSTATSTRTATATRTPTRTPTPTPPVVDTDGDGCTDVRELGPDEHFGGRRDPQNPWDFYDPLGPGGFYSDQYIDLPNDILGVAMRYTAGGGAYDPSFDRSHAPPGADPWDMGPPDFTIDLTNDILGVAFQYQHDCR